MIVTVRYFASLADRAGTSEESIDVAAGTDVEGLWRLVASRHPALAQIAYRPMAACDLAYAEWSRVLDGVGEVAFLPPVSGG
jgi:molybdopterin converting factor subunit 1